MVYIVTEVGLGTSHVIIDLWLPPRSFARGEDEESSTRTMKIILILISICL